MSLWKRLSSPKVRFVYIYGFVIHYHHVKWVLIIMIIFHNNDFLDIFQFFSWLHFYVNSILDNKSFHRFIFSRTKNCQKSRFIILWLSPGSGAQWTVRALRTRLYFRPQNGQNYPSSFFDQTVMFQVESSCSVLWRNWKCWESVEKLGLYQILGVIEKFDRGSEFKPPTSSIHREQDVQWLAVIITGLGILSNEKSANDGTRNSPIRTPKCSSSSKLAHFHVFILTKINILFQDYFHSLYQSVHSSLERTLNRNESDESQDESSTDESSSKNDSEYEKPASGETTPTDVTQVYF